ncbi:hypothetical protein PIB30_041012 [Stylosanthes scabra]|uniref:Uncharacterized protein n=1 Tax=Stylosanthes scabra TaxID=79078 RepID=A0ABU6YDQ2_9FABA|nr:hypothetical protein [Stylosanthes scabra]
MTIHLYHNGFNQGYWIWTSHGEVDVDNINRFETRVQRPVERQSRRANNLNRDVAFQEVNWEDNQERYNEMMTDAFGTIKKGIFDPDNNVCTQAISNMIELMLNEPWINYSEILAEVQKRWYEKWAEGFTWPQEQEKQIRKAFDYRVARRYQQIMRDLREGELQRLKWLSETLRARLLHRFATDLGFLKCSGVNKTRSLDRPPADAETVFSTNLEQATQQTQEEGDKSAGTIDLNAVWRQTLSEPCKNRVYGAGGFFASSLRTSSYGGSSAYATSSHASLADAEVVDLREQVQNLTQSRHSQGEVLQQQIDEVCSLKETLAERDARSDDQIRCLGEMQRQMVAYYDPLRAMSGNTAVGGLGGSSTAPPPLPPRPPPPPAQPDHGPTDDDDDYEDA